MHLYICKPSLTYIYLSDIAIYLALTCLLARRNSERWRMSFAYSAGYAGLVSLITSIFGAGTTLTTTSHTLPQSVHSLSMHLPPQSLNTATA